MNKCSSCGNKNAADHSSCVNCGEPLRKRGAKNSSSRKNISVMLIAVIVIVIVAIIGYQTLAKKYNEEAIVDQFLTALTNHDEGALKTLIVPKDSRIKITPDSLQALFELIDKNPSLYQEIESSLKNESLTSDLFTIRQDGKAYGLFSKYVIEPTGYIIEVQTVGEKTMILLNDAELGFIENAGESTEFGPFLAGNYHLKATTMIGNDQVEDQVDVSLSGVQAKVTLTFMKAEEAQKQKLAAQEQSQKEEAKKAEEQKAAAEKVVVKEVIREVPVPVGGNDFYIIPYSDYAYLTKSDLSGLSKSDLRLARNEIYARYGHVFNSKDLKNYFNSQSWYYPNPSYNGKLSDVEQHNVDFIKSFE